MKNRILPVAALLAMALLQSIDAAAQMPPELVEKMVKYAQCIRANGYPDYPDPSPDGRMQFKLDPKNSAKFEAARNACKDKAPLALAELDKNATPERMQVLLAFAECMRRKGVKDFPDPSPKGVFEFASPGTGNGNPQAQEAMKACQASNPPGGLMIRMAAPK